MHVDDFTDLDMAWLQAVENFTQSDKIRAAVTLDAIGGLYEVVAYLILSGKDVSRTAWRPNQKALEIIRGKLASGEGIGTPTFLNLLPKGCVSFEAVKIALQTLKDGGLLKPIMARVYAKIAADSPDPCESATRALAAVEEREITLDPRVTAQLGWSNHQIREWNREIRTPGASRYIPVANQFELANAINEKGKQLVSENPKFSLTADLIVDHIRFVVMEAGITQGKITREERAQGLQGYSPPQRRVVIQVDALRRACAELERLKKEYGANPELGFFLFDGSTHQDLTEVRKSLNNLLTLE